MSQASLERLRDAHARMKRELHRVIVGQDEVIDQLLLAILSRGHCLLVGVPGLAKTLLISSLAKTLDLGFNRIQFTPDLMPGDITGTDLLHIDAATNERVFRFAPGPVFANVVLADEINRTPPKTQAALLEAMQEGRVSVGRVRHRLVDPFFVLATQNPSEQEGTYPLPEAQQDRFMFKVFVRYPSFAEEFEIARRTTGVQAEEAEAVLSAADILALQRSVREVPVSDHLIRYALALVRQTRAGERGVPEFVSDQLAWGAGPRAVQFLIVGAKARAILQGRPHVAVDDIRALAPPVLRHRIVLGFAAASEGVTPDAVIQRIVESTPAREDELSRDPRFQSIFAS
ncbi:MAG: AAA family ATPase [Planctomycetota bacterium]